ncbi:MAG: sugar ABC transporter permease [Chloroflexi bacterium]|nr:sugar ABC transporter permease [Chloroflexota bacterium]
MARAAGGYALLLPSALFLIPFTIWPALRVLYGSLFQQDLSHPRPSFAGLQNFADEFANPNFWLVLKNTAIYMAGTVPVSVVLALLLALGLNRGIARTGVLRASLFYPAILPSVGAAAVWLYIYVPTFGLLDRFLGLFGVATHNWLGDPGLVLPALVVLTIWKQSGFFMIFYLAALQALPAEIFDAARLEGARGLRLIRTMIVPLVSGTTVFVVTVALIDAVQSVDQLFVLTQGGPNNASNLLLFFLYQEGFRNFNIGHANAVTVIMMVLLLAISILNYRALDRSAHYEQ